MKYIKYFNENLEIKIGDVFSEMLSFWITVIKITDTGEILTIESNKEDIQVYKSDIDFKHYCSYKSNGMNDKYWIDYMYNDLELMKKSIDNWKSNNKHQDKTIGKRQIRIDQIVYDI